jgi:hypothetical protein
MKNLIEKIVLIGFIALTLSSFSFIAKNSSKASIEMAKYIVEKSK